MSLVIAKAIKLIELVAAGTDTLAAIAKASEMSRSTTHRLLATLVEFNYLSLADRRYSLGFRLMELGEQKKRSFSFGDALRPIMFRYAEATSDTIHLAVLDGMDIVVIDRAPGSRQLQIGSYVGQRSRALMTAVGKVLVGRLPPQQWGAYLNALPANAPRSAEHVLADLRIARERNLATDFNECDIGTCGIASAFPVANNRHVAASINGAIVYFENGRFEQLAKTTLSMSEELRQAAEGTIPDAIGPR